jgi:CubicO group peptidase (beta-lactamase class C family)
MSVDSGTSERIDAVFAEMSAPQHPGAALLVADGGEIVYQRGYGLADIETQQPIQSDTSFYLASLSKQFTAMAIMLLAEQGKLRYEDRLVTYFPQFPQWAAGITVRYLLQHTSGMPEYFPLFTPHSDGTPVREFTHDITNISNHTVLDRVIREAAPDFPVGERYAYCNTGYVLLALIVNAVSGQSFGDFLKANVFDPLGMKHTLVYTAARPIIHKLAQGYIREEDHFERWDYPLLTAGDGGMFSTLDDLFRWDRALNTERLVSKPTLAQAFTSGTTNDGTSIGYGFGWMTQVFAGMRHVAHGGSLVAYNNYMIRFLDSPRTIIVLTNHQYMPGPRVRAHEVAEIVFGYRPTA